MKKAMVHLGKANKDRSIELIRQISDTILANYNESILVEADDKGIETLQSKGFRVREIPDTPIVEIGGYRINTESPSIRTSTSSLSDELVSPSGLTHQILHIIGPMLPEWKKNLEDLGVVFRQSLTQENYYLISVDKNRILEIQQQPFVQAMVPYFPTLKVNPALLSQEVQSEISNVPSLSLIEPIGANRKRGVSEKTFDDTKPFKMLANTKMDKKIDEEKEGNLELLLFDQKDQKSVIETINNMNEVKIVDAGPDRIIVFASNSLIPQLASIPYVREVNPHNPKVLHNNIAREIINVETIPNPLALDGTNQTVAVADTGLDIGIDDANICADFRGQIANIFSLGRPGNASDMHGHGTHVAGSIMGNGSNSNGLIKGIAPAAKLVFFSLMDSNRGLGGIPSDLGSGLFALAQNSGATMINNSWGDIQGTGAYDSQCRQADSFAFKNRNFLICFSAGNEGEEPEFNNITPPGTAKNVLTVGASESERPLPSSVRFPPSPRYPNGPSIPNLSSDADNRNHVASFSSRGPVQNNRLKPDVVAPGSWILSVRASVCTEDVGPDGISNSQDEDGIFTHGESVGYGLPGRPVMGSGDKNTPPLPQGAPNTAFQNYMYNSGTSMAAPITVGACALTRQYLILERGISNPSAALIKAIMVNGAVDMGTGIPNNEQGWGRINIKNSLIPANSNGVQFDDNLNNSLATGDIRTYEFTVFSPGSLLAVTLVWRDPAGNTIQNKIHLRVIEVSSGRTFTSDNIDDIRNNVQKIVIEHPATGEYRIEIEGINIIKGIPELLPNIRQDFALAVTNANQISLIE